MPVGNPYGTIPSPISLGPNIFQQTTAALPSLASSTKGAGDVVSAEEGGVLSPATRNALKTASAQFGISSGMGPGSGLEANQLFGNIAGFSENRQRQGVQDYLSLLGGIGRTMTDPGLAVNVAERNSLMAAAPDPAAAAHEQLRLYDKYQRGGSPWWGQFFGTPAGGSVMPTGAGSVLSGSSAAGAAPFLPTIASPAGGTGSWYGGGAEYGSAPFNPPMSGAYYASTLPTSTGTTPGPYGTTGNDYYSLLGGSEEGTSVPG